MNEFERGYVCGVIDSEAGIDLHNRRISITNTSLEMLEFIQRIIGGKIYIHNHEYVDKHSFHHQTSWRLNIHRKEHIVRLLRIILPNLKIKQKAVQQLLQAAEKGLWCKWSKRDRELGKIGSGDS